MDILRKIKEITDNFEREYFGSLGSESTIFNIKKDIESFEERNPELVNSFRKSLILNFPNSNIENYTHFFDGDRCARFLVEIDNQLRFICQISIYNFFSVYQHSMKYANGRYEYDEVTFINNGESDYCDKMYHGLNNLSKDFIWLGREILSQVIPELSILGNVNDYNDEIKIADVLFTSHYL